MLGLEAAVFMARKLDLPNPELHLYQSAVHLLRLLLLPIEEGGIKDIDAALFQSPAIRPFEECQLTVFRRTVRTAEIH